MLRLRRMRAPRWEGGGLPNTVRSRMETRAVAPGEQSLVRTIWMQFDPPARAVEAPSRECQLQDDSGFWLIYPDRREFCLLSPTLCATSEALKQLESLFVAQCAMVLIRKHGVPFPPEFRDELHILEAAAETVEPEGRQFHWKSRTQTSRFEGFLRYNPEDGWVRHLEGIERELHSGEIVHHGLTTAFEYNPPLPLELFDPAAAGFRRIEPSEIPVDP